MGQAASSAGGVLSSEQQAVTAAILEGRIEDARRLLEANPGLVYVHSARGLNVWHLAAQSGDAKVVDLVATAVADALAHQKQSDALLQWAGAGLGAVSMTVNQIAAATVSATTAAIPAQLVGRNLDKDAMTHEGKTALMVALSVGSYAAARALLACGVDAWRGDVRGNTALHQAAWRGDAEAVALMLEAVDAAEAAGGGFDARRAIDAFNLAGLTPLHLACWRGHAPILRALVNAGADMAAGAAADSMGDVACSKGSTPLHLAALKGDVPIIALLLRAHSRLLEAARGGALGESRTLRDLRRLPDAYGRTPYTVAFDLGRSEAAATLDPTVPLQEAINRARSGGVWQPKPLTGADALGGPRSPRAAGLIKAVRTPAAAPVSAGPPAAAAALGPSPPPLAPPPRAAHAVPALPPPPGPRRAAAAAEAPKPSDADEGRCGQEDSPSQQLAAEKQSREHEHPSEEGGRAEPGQRSRQQSAEGFRGEEPAVLAGTAENPLGPMAAAGGCAEPAPPELVCPITGEVFVDPVRACDGKCYEREAIEMWLQLGNSSFPGGGVRITGTQLTPDAAVQEAAAAWRAAHPAT